jgi:LuxR family transcriptional regulator, maltose regulon positive regulatory protein
MICMSSLAKISRPRLARVHRRERLFARIDECIAQGSLWIWGPPGAGKSTLVVSYLDARRLPVLWYQIDSDDADPANIFNYLRRAVQQVGLAPPDALPIFASQHLREVGHFTRRYFRSLYESLHRPCAIVFDNYQDVRCDAAIHNIVRDAMSEAPDDVHFIVISRDPPTSSYARLRAGRRLKEIEWSDLRLTDGEVRDVVSQLQDSNLLRAAELARRCEGWVAGLVLLLNTEFARTCDRAVKSQRAVFDYFATELFDGLPAESQHVLLTTSLLPAFTVEIAEEISNSRLAGIVLHDLQSRHLFTQLRSGVQQSYEYHALLREFLVHRFEQSYETSERAGIVSHAARLMARMDDPEAALRLHLAAGEVDSAAKIVIDNALGMMREGRTQTLDHWICSLPADCVRSMPRLLYWHGSARSCIDRDAGREMFERAFVLFQSHSDLAGQVSCVAAIVENIHYEFLEPVRLDRWLEVLGSLLAESTGRIDSLTEITGYASLLVAAMTRPPSGRRFEQWVARIDVLLDSVDDVNARVKAATALLTVLLLTGEGRSIMALSARIRSDLASPQLQPVLLCQWLLPRSFTRVCFEGNIPAAQRDIDLVSTIVADNGLASLEAMVCLVRVLVGVAAGDIVIDRDESRHAAAVDPPTHGNEFHLAMAGTELLTGDHQRAIECATHATRACADGWLMSLTSSLYLASAQCAAQDYASAISTCRVASECYFRITDRSAPNDPAFIHAYALLMAGQRSESESLLRERLPLFARQGCVGTTVWMPQMMSRLFAFALDRGIEVDWIRYVILLRGLAPPNQELEVWPWRVRIRSLGRFEILVNDKPLAMSRKAPTRLLGLLATLTSFGGAGVRQQRLADALWADADGDTAMNLLATCVHRVRNLLGESTAIDVCDGLVSLGQRSVWTDVGAFEWYVESAESAETLGERRHARRTAIALYRGQFLADRTENREIISARERLSAKFARLVASESCELEAGGSGDEASLLIRRASEIDSTIGPFLRSFQRRTRLELHTARLRNDKDASEGVGLRSV